MKVILSPAKKLNDQVESFDFVPTEIKYASKAQKLVSKLKRKSAKQIGELMHISPALSDLNHERFQKWHYPFDQKEVKPAAFAFDGEAYTGLDVRSFSAAELGYAQENLVILSGLYGMLRPLDNIMPYRLEMGTRLHYSDQIKNLYAYWGDQLAKDLQARMAKDEVLVNVASNEYSKVLNLKKLDRRVVTPVFKEQKGDDFKVLMVYAKKARGMMSQFVIKNQIDQVEDLKAFEMEGYRFNPELSQQEDELVFTRWFLQKPKSGIKRIVIQKFILFLVINKTSLLSFVLNEVLY